MKLIKAGESHGKIMMGILSDVPNGIKVFEEQINFALSERNFAYGRSERQAIERDKIDFITGIRNGETIGNNVGIVIENAVHGDYGDMMGEFNADLSKGELTAVRPGHADLPGVNRFLLNDARNVLEGASARNTCIDVVGGVFAINMLAELGIELSSYVVALGGEKDCNNYSFEQTKSVTAPFFTANKEFEKNCKEIIENALRTGDSVGGSVQIRVKNIKQGFGSYVGEKRINSVIARHIMQIQAVKGVYFGIFPFNGNFGSEYADSVEFLDRVTITTANSGGIDGGMTNGGEIVITVGIKPIPTLKRGVETIDIKSGKKCISAKERADVTAVFALCPILKSVVALSLSEVVSERLGCDNMQRIIERYKVL